MKEIFELGGEVRASFCLDLEQSTHPFLVFDVSESLLNSSSLSLPRELECLYTVVSVNQKTFTPESTSRQN